jgi:group I intron endonuclease
MTIDPVIYAIFNIVNDKCYVGQALRKNRRLSDHRCSFILNTHKNKHLQAAYNKYEKDAFIYVILENLFDASNINKREQWWIDKLKPEYNQAPVAGSCVGFRHSQETRDKLSQIRKGKKRTGQALENIKNGWKKRGPVSDEARENMRKAQLGSKQSEQTKAKRALAMKGNKNNVGKRRSQPMPKETRKKIGAGNYAAHRRKNSIKALDEI